MRIRHFVICGLLRSTIFFSTLSHKRHNLRKTITEHKKCVLIFSTIFVRNISHSKKKWARYDKKICIGPHVKCRYYCQILMKLEFSRQIFEKSIKAKFHETPPSGSRVVPCGRTDRRIDMTKLIVVFSQLLRTRLRFYVLPTLYLCVSHLSQNKQRLFPYRTSTDWFYNRDKVFTARYELGLELKQLMRRL